MNKAKYDALPPDLKKVIDANSGEELSGADRQGVPRGRRHGQEDRPGEHLNVIPSAELDNWNKLGEPVADAWVADITAKGANGKQLLEDAKTLIAKHAPK